MNNPLTKIDFYKADHRRQYPDRTTKVYSNFTARKSRIPQIQHIVFFGMQFIILSYLIEEWNKNFFNKPKDKVVARYKRRMDNALGLNAIPVHHIEALHDLGYLPLEIKAVPEGTLVPIRVPCFTITNTREEQFWLVNYLETVLSNKIWKPCTSASIAFHYKKVFQQYYEKTVGAEDNSSIMWQGHDFSYRGMSGDEDACTSGAAHLLSFYGTDTVPAIDFLEDYYFADSDKEIIGGSIPATEHSVMCMGGMKDEFETFRRLICDIYPSGLVAIVSDTWDYWQVVDEYLPRLKTEILARTGSPTGMNKVVIRPDSGDPYRIIVGYFEDEVRRVILTSNPSQHQIVVKETGNVITQSEFEGTVERLWGIFGGSTTEQGYRQLDPHIGLIYGDSITMDRQEMILAGLARKGFASTNIVLGIGSFTYEYQTRDTFGFAMKATYGEITEGHSEDSDPSYNITIAREIYKDPKTDDGTKKSARGLIQVFENAKGELELKDRCTWQQERDGILETVFLDGEIMRTQSLNDIRQLVASYL